MSNLSIPTALDPYDNHVPISEAIDKLDYYRCPECREFLTPRIGPQRQYFAHKRGVLKDTECSLSSQQDIRRMVDKLRESDIEEEEKERSIRLHLGEKYKGHLDCFGIIPTLEWKDFLPEDDVDGLLEQTEITTSGIKNPPVPANFHPTESEVSFDVNPTADTFVIEIDGPAELERITGRWTADGLKKGDLFIGDQSRARRHRSNRLIKQGEWVYVTVVSAPPNLPDVVSVYELPSFDVLAFPARAETEDLLEKYGNGLTTDDYGFDADVILPAETHPTIEAPIYGKPSQSVLVGIRPSEEIDPVFEVISIPKTSNQVEIPPTGAGNPRFYTTEIPAKDSRRVSIHQRNSNRHRLIHLHPDADDCFSTIQMPDRPIGLRFEYNDETTHLSPLSEIKTVTVDPDFEPLELPYALEYDGPDGFELELQASFIDASQLGPTITRITTDIEEIVEEMIDWIEQGCEEIQVVFDGIGSVSLKFPQPDLARGIEA